MKVLQIIPANGYSAQCQDEPKARPYYLPVLAWALIEDDSGETRMAGMVLDAEGFIQNAEDMNLSGYIKK